MEPSRRAFIRKAALTSAVAAAFPPFNARSAHVPQGQSPAALTFVQDKLPYSYAQLEPHIDAATMEIHYTKHHAAYVKNVNEALTAEGSSFTAVEDLFAGTSKVSARIRNNGGGAWNHNFFWSSMAPGISMPGKVTDALSGTFGSPEKFKELFTQAALSRFGSGWAWLVRKEGKLSVGSTPNQDNPLMDVSELRGTPIVALDVWEHAYYLKYQNKRNEYVAAWWNIVNWEVVAERLG